jgi:hypothetical protein
MASLGNALSNAANSLLGEVTGLFTGTNPATQTQIGTVFNTNIPGVPLVSTRDFFLFQLSSWITSFPLMSQWICVIETYPSALNTGILQGLERTGGSKNEYDINLAKTILTSYPFQRVSGCLFANNVVIPKEDFEVKTASVPNNRGFIPGIVAGNRASYAGKPLSINFFEISTSFLDTIIRPWIILASHYGLVARSGDTPGSRSSFNIKTNIYFLFFNRTYTDVSMVPRKVFKFYNCVPISMAPQEYGYEEPNTVKSYNVDFTYTNYTVENSLFLPLPSLISSLKSGDTAASSIINQSL